MNNPIKNLMEAGKDIIKLSFVNLSGGMKFALVKGDKDIEALFKGTNVKLEANHDFVYYFTKTPSRLASRNKQFDTVVNGNIDENDQYFPINQLTGVVVMKAGTGEYKSCLAMLNDMEASLPKDEESEEVEDAMVSPSGII